MTAGELDAGNALLDGRLDLSGDFSVVTRLGFLIRRAERFAAGGAGSVLAPGPPSPGTWACIPRSPDANMCSIRW